jgi:hypothetical protein
MNFWKSKQLEINWIFLREFIQNASDATKTQFFDDIYHNEDWIFEECKTEFDPCFLTPDTVIYGPRNQNYYGESSEKDKWQFYKKVSRSRINNAAIQVSVECHYPENAEIDNKCNNINHIGNNGYEFIIKIKDHGIGIDKQTLKNMRSIGKKSQVFDNRKIPSWLAPTASFGIGMQSAFELNTEFSANSRAKSDNKSRRIIFRSADIGGEVFSYEISNKNRESFGTEFTFKIPASKIAEQYGIQFINKDRVFRDIKAYIIDHIKNDLFPIEVTFIDSIHSSKINSDKPNNYKFCVPSIFELLFLSNNPEEQNSEYNPDDFYFTSYDKNDGSLTVLRLSHNNNASLNENRNGINVIYRGIKVESRLATLFYSDITAYVWGGQASEILKINRDEFLNAGNDLILEKIHNAYTKLSVEIITNENQNGKINLDYYLNSNHKKIRKYLLSSQNNPDIGVFPLSVQNSSLTIPTVTLYPSPNSFNATKVINVSLDYILENWQNIWFTAYPLEQIKDKIELHGLNETIIICENIFDDLKKCYNKKIKPNQLIIAKTEEGYFSAYKYGLGDFCDLLINDNDPKHREFYYKYLNDEITKRFAVERSLPSCQFNESVSYLYIALPLLSNWIDGYKEIILEMSNKRKFDTITGVDLSSKYILLVVESNYRDNLNKIKNKNEKDENFINNEKFINTSIKSYIKRIMKEDYCQELMSFMANQNNTNINIVRDIYEEFLYNLYKMLL